MATHLNINNQTPAQQLLELRRRIKRLKYIAVFVWCGAAIFLTILMGIGFHWF